MSSSSSRRTGKKQRWSTARKAQARPSGRRPAPTAKSDTRRANTSRDGDRRSTPSRSSDRRPATAAGSERREKHTYAAERRTERGAEAERRTSGRRPDADRRSNGRPTSAERPTSGRRPDADRRDSGRPSAERRVPATSSQQKRGPVADRTSGRRPETAAPVTSPVEGGFADLGLPDSLVQVLTSAGITTPFPIQQATIPDALAGKDVLGRGQTGSGKTLAFGLPTLTRLSGARTQSRRPRALVLLPTRELALQVSDALTPLARAVGLGTLVVAGGLSYTPQLKALERGVDVLIATPGRLRDLLDRKAVLLDEVEVAVLDEADHMADMGFLPEVTAILDLVPEGGQRLLFSATLDNGIDTLVQRYLVDPVTHSTDDSTAAVSTMEHHVLLIEPTDKKRITAELANRPGRTLVFVRTKLGADRVALQMREAGVLAAALHGGLTQGVRNRVLDAFKDGRVPVLVATDVAARGIHVDDVSLVLQADPPQDHKDYLHRSGRTARAGEKGVVATLALPHQRRTIERMMRNVELDVTPTPVRPGHHLVATIGGRTPTGAAITESSFRGLIDPPRRGRGGRPGGHPGRRGDHRGSGSGRSNGRGQGQRAGRGRAPARSRGAQ